MPRKVKFGTDYDDDYDYYDDDDYYDYDIEEQGKSSDNNQAIAKPGFWRCTICTYDNEERLSSCDICGAVRESSVDLCTNSDEKMVDDMCKASGASIMARSLFAPLPRRKPKMAIMFQQLNDDYLCKEANNPLMVGKIEGNFYDFQKAFTARDSRNHINIARFKFDSFSPDDLVSAGKHSYVKDSKAKSLQSSPSKISSSVTEKGAGKSLPATKRSETSSSTSSAQAGQPSGIKRFGGNKSPVTDDKPGTLTSSLHNLNLDANASHSRVAKGISNTAVYASDQFKPEAWMLDQEEGISNQLNLAIVGHVDSGKSTLSGRLLHLLGQISQKEMHKYEKEAKQKGKGSFAYAWALDESGEERERGITMTVAVAYFETKKYRVVVLDSPGHKDFVPNMISGAAQADAAILVVDACGGAFEAGMTGDGGGGQTKEHAHLIRSFGVEQIIVAVNKMDVVDYSKERFDFIKLQLGTFLRSCGFKESFVAWIPLSAMENQNLVINASDLRLSSWYKGLHLLDAIDSLRPPVRDISKPLRMPVCDVIKLHSSGQVAASGKLEAGAIRNGSKVLVMPSGDLATVRSIERDSRACSTARAGDNVAVGLQGIDIGRIMTGGVLCHPDFPVLVAACLELKVLILDITMPILVGSQVEFHIHHAKEAARVVRILSVLDPKSGKVSKKAPRCLTAKQSATLEVLLDRAVCVEEFSECRALGRVYLRASGKTVAVGIVTQIIQHD